MKNPLQAAQQRPCNNTRPARTSGLPALRRFGRLSSLLAGTMLFSFTPALHAEYKGEFIPFPLVTVHYNDRDLPSLEQHGSEAAVNFFYSAEYGKARLLAEFYLDNEEREMERLAVGWAATDNTRLWLGRFHTGLDQWNRKHHHGAYLQTTIYRPGIIEFEDDGGALPSHSTGLSLQTSRNGADHIDHFTFDFGVGPALSPGHLESLDILKPGKGEYDLFAAVSVSRQPMDKPFDDSGIYLGYTVVPSSAAGIDEVKLNILGAYSNYSMGAWYLRGSVMRIGTGVDTSSGNTVNQSFLYGYLQPEYTLNARWLLYGRAEVTQHAAANLYLAEIPEYIRHRTLIGVRHQIARGQALKFELAKQNQFGQDYAQATVQWSAALP